MAVIFVASSPVTGASKCPTAQTTLEVNQCLSDDLEVVAAEQTTYLAAAQERIMDESQLKLMLSSEQKAWENYREIHCDNVYDYWAQGTIRVAKNLTCSAELTRERTHDIWRAFLRYADSTPPILPEPELQ
ncbi:MAG: DUF1311 domain-containing protein [Gammaproteobacteria bacterium]|nr:DUF1311 domain-containing protein [Gammaproteobacteria bacterium]